jgi:Reverse transcriptase (RNA-dependent DNA polymerase).
VDDLLIHSSSFCYHLDHLDRGFHKLTAAGFTINASKCNFCKPEIKFLGHIICDKTVKADPEGIVAILRCPVTN